MTPEDPTQPAVNPVENQPAETPTVVEVESRKEFKDPEVLNFAETIEEYSKVSVGEKGAVLDLKPQMLQVMRDVLEGNAKRSKQALSKMSDADVIKTYHGYGFTQDEIHNATMQLASQRPRNIGETGKNVVTGNEELITENNFRNMQNSDRGMYSNARDLVLLASIDADMRFKGLNVHDHPRDLDDMILVKSYRKSRNVVLRSAPKWLASHIAWEQRMAEVGKKLDGPKKGEIAPILTAEERFTLLSRSEKLFETLDKNRTLQLPAGEFDYAPAMMVVARDALSAYYAKSGQGGAEKVRSKSDRDVLIDLYRKNPAGDGIWNTTQRNEIALSRSIGKEGNDITTGEPGIITEENFRNMTGSRRGTYLNAQDLLVLTLTETRLMQAHDTELQQATEDFTNARKEILRGKSTPDWLKAKCQPTKEQTAILDMQRHRAEAAVQGDKLWEQFSNEMAQGNPDLGVEAVLTLQTNRGLFQVLSKTFPDAKADIFDMRSGTHLNAKQRLSSWLRAIEKRLPGTRYEDDEQIVSALKKLKTSIQ